MAKGLDCLIPSLLFMKGALIDNQRSSNKFAAIGNRSALCLPGSFRRRGFQPNQVVYLDDSNLCSCIALFAESGLADGYVPDTAKW